MESRLNVDETQNRMMAWTNLLEFQQCGEEFCSHNNHHNFLSIHSYLWKKEKWESEHHIKSTLEELCAL